MSKLSIIIIVLLCSKSIHAQRSMLQFKKGRKIISSYWEGTVIAFQLRDGEWKKGVIKKINEDSIYIQPSVVSYKLIGTDTFTFNTMGFSIAEIYAMPKRGILIDYKNGSFQISRSGGHVHWYWIKSGVLFRVGAAAYLGVVVANGLYDKDYKITYKQLAYGAGVFGFGVLLKHLYKPTLKIGKKYHFKILSV